MFTKDKDTPQTHVGRVKVLNLPANFKHHEDALEEWVSAGWHLDGIVGIPTIGGVVAYLSKN